MASLENPRPIGDAYQLIRLIGSGSMGNVYQARDIRTNQIVAIKQLKQDAIENVSELVDRFKREGQALRQLNHPNIVKMLEAFEENNQHYLVMEYITGGSLADLLKRQRQLEVTQILKIGLEVADALTRTHHLKIVHRDLKPANVLLAEDGTVRLTDFGIAHLESTEQLTEIGRLIGTPDYLSPEYLNGSEADSLGDIWAFGIMLFEMLAGKRPFTGETLSQTAAAILTKPTPNLETLRPDAPVALIDLIYQMLAKDPQQRINSVRIIGAEIESITRTLGGSARRVISLHDRPASSLGKPRQNNLPAQTTAFIGREAELHELARLLSEPDTRLITILAPGGMGKTRLALETAKAHLESFSDGVFFISLAPLNTADAIVRAIIEAIRYSFSASIDPKQQLLEILSNKQMLLVLDNFEHLLSGASLVAEILETAPAVKIIATSRSRLNLQGETVFSLQGMENPKTSDDALNYTAAKLFIQIAQQVQPGFALKGDDATYLTRICHQVEGLPLGLVLAAVWVDTLSLSEISVEIARNLNFLETEQQNIPARQRSIQAVFDYSWNLLSVDERAVFIKLSVFQGDFTRDAAEKVAGATLKTLAALVSKSMLRRNADNGRYSIHELLRQYAAQKLDEASLTDETRKAHSDYFVDYVDERLLDMQGRRQIAALREMDTEFNNLRTAWQYLLDHQITNRLVNFITAFWAYFDFRSRHRDGLRLATDALEVFRTLPPADDLNFLIGHTQGIQAYHYAGVASFENSEREAKEAIAILEPLQNLESLAIAWCGLSLGYGVAGNPAFAEAAEKFAEIAISTHKQWLMTRGYMWLGLAHWANPVNAQQQFQKCLSIAQENGDTYFLAAAYLRLGELANVQQAYSEAMQYAEKALPYFEKVGQPWSIQQTENLAGNAAFNLKNYADAAKHFRRGLSAYREYASIDELLSFVLREVEILTEQNQNVKAVELLSLILNYPELKNYIRNQGENFRKMLATKLASEPYTAAWERGKILHLETVVDDLLAES